MRISKSKKYLTAAILAVSAGSTELAMAAGSSWTFNGSGNWTTASNWLGGVPGAGGDAFIVQATIAPRTINYDYTGASITLNSMTVDCNSTGYMEFSQFANTFNVATEVVGGNGIGHLILGGGTNNVTSQLLLGTTTSGKGIGTMTGGLLSLNSIFGATIGSSGQGTFTQSDGTVSFVNNSALFVGGSSTGTGTYNLNGGTMSLPNGGRLVLGAGGSAGTFNLAGGTLSTSYLGIATNNSLFKQTAGVTTVGTQAAGGTVEVIASMYALSGAGSLTTFGTIALHGSGSFNQSGGTHLLVGTIETFTPQFGTGTYSLTGGVLAGTITLQGAGSFIASNSGTITANLTQQGATIGGVYRNQGTFNYVSGAFTGELLNQGSVSLANPFTATAGIENDAQFTIPQLQSVTTSGGVGFLNFGTLTLAGSLGGGSITNQSGGVINASGNMQQFCTNNGILNLSGRFSGVSLVNNGQTNLPVGANTFFGTLNNNGQMILSGGAMQTVLSNNAGGVVQGGGALIGAVNNFAGGLIFASNPTISLTIDNLQISNAGSTIRVANGSTLNINNPSGFINGGLIDLQGSNASLGGASLTNSSTGSIKGSGALNQTVLNGGTIRPVGELDLNATGNTNGGATPGQIILDSGNTLFFSQGLASNQGSIAMTGGVFDNNGQTITNTGYIQGNGTLRTGGLTNFNQSTIAFGAGSSSVMGSFVNSASFSPPIGSPIPGGNVVITGGGAVTFYGAASLGSGSSFKVDTNSTAIFLGSLTGLSAISGSGTKYFASTASGGALVDSGASIIEAGAALTADFVRENSLAVSGTAAINASGLPTHFSRLNTLTITAGSVDLANNSLIVDSTSVGTIAAYIKSAYNNGSWNGSGLGSGSALLSSNSSHKTALGYAAALKLGLSSFDGQPVGPSSVLVKYTYSGDANLDGNVNALDFNALASNFGTTPGSDIWLQGDFNYDGSVTTSDFTLLASNFNAMPLGAPVLGSLVPEPASFAAVGIMFLLARHQRRSVGAF